jgi:TonB family protein
MIQATLIGLFVLVASPDTEPATLIQQVAPHYPAKARKANVQGTVIFSAVITKEGRLQDVMVVEGHPLLIDAARQAVLKWRYKPALRDGSPIEDTTNITMQFSAGRAVSTRDNQHSGRSSDFKQTPDLPQGVFYVGPGITPPRLENGANPRYTDRARKAREKGRVSLRIIVTPEGTVRDPEVLTADKKLGADLIQNAMEVVQMWKFIPAMKDGEPVSVRIAVTVTFDLR